MAKRTATAAAAPTIASKSASPKSHVAVAIPNHPTGKPIATKSNGSLSAPKREVTHEMIAERAYEISMSGTGGSPDDNWYRAERELRGGA